MVEPNSCERRTVGGLLPPESSLAPTPPARPAFHRNESAGAPWPPPARVLRRPGFLREPMRGGCLASHSPPRAPHASLGPPAAASSSRRPQKDLPVPVCVGNLSPKRGAKSLCNRSPQSTLDTLLSSAHGTRSSCSLTSRYAQGRPACPPAGCCNSSPPCSASPPAGSPAAPCSCSVS